MNNRIWFVAGCGTDVGKTTATASLLLALRRSGARCQAVKPVQTGCWRDADGGLAAPDAMVYAEACPEAARHVLAAYEPACSPELAARLSGERLDAARLAERTRRLAAEADVTLVEAAGGLLAPVDGDLASIDFAQALGADVVLVFANVLGAINQALCGLEIVRARGIEPLALIAVETAPAENDLDARIRLDNLDVIRRWGEPALLAALPYRPEPAWDEFARLLMPVAGRAAADAEESEELLAFDAAHLWHPYAPTHPPAPAWPAAATAGCRIRLADGRELIDGMSSWWAAIHGYNHPRLLDALRRQAGVMPHVMFGGFTHAPAVALGRELRSILPDGLDRFFYADSGSVAVEAALKMAVQYQAALGKAEKNRLLAPLGGYHGDTFGAMSVCDPENGMHRLFRSVMPEHIFVPRPTCRFGGDFDPGSVRELEDAFARHGRNLAAAIIEPVVQGAGGMWFYHPDYVRRLRQLCDEYDVLLIADEIATGFGRTGKLFACDWAGVRPDILCVGKALTGGCMTLAAVAAMDQVAATISRNGVFMHGPTFMANPLACAVATASLRLLAETPWRERVASLERRLEEGLAPCRGMSGIADVRVLGAIGVVETASAANASRLQRFFVERGVWIRPFGRLVYLMPPYVASGDEVDALTAAVRDAVASGSIF